jgi:arylsulfatase A-like enzyme
LDDLWCGEQKNVATVEKREHRESSNPGHPLRWVEIVQGGIVGLVVVLLVAVALFAYRGGAMAAFLGSSPPDVIIFVVADAMRADRVSCYGYAAKQTPHISSLARDGVLYRHMDVQCSWTKPSVATFFTSLYPSTHQARSFEDLLSDEVLTLPEILAVHDYHTVGFVTNYAVFPKFNFQQGFREYYALDGIESSWHREGQKYYQEAELMNRSVLPWLEANRDRRFFMYLHYMDPHRPYFLHPYDGRSLWCEDPTRVKEVSDAYDGEIAYFDKHFGDLLATLKRLGLYDKALIIFTSDHGEELYEHQGWAHNKTLYQEITNVPLIIKYPGNAGAGTVDEGLARGLDITPTVLDGVGVEPPAGMQGISLRLPPDSPARARFSYAETSALSWVISIRTPRYKLIEIIDGKLRGRTPTQLYDLEADPGEQTNLAASHPDIVARLRADMSQTLTLAERAAVSGQEADLDPEFRERLRQLGY